MGPAAGGAPLLAASESALATVLGVVQAPTQVDRHGWQAQLRVERVIGGALAETRPRIAWEELAPGRPLRVVLHHEDGSEETFAVSHTLNDEQIGWFRAGSALNLMRAGA